ncbi:hypothetical protein EOJ36_07700 [Sandaracinomonas limnophila]|uniref:Outer membrane protein beta-barrel domain-containing protein n=1 Tax=Sandaracinomonas limnophila TaxID=1862386 RepID=A0A437PRK6_9BACT|nr:hypothetical protein [Sandaracinomonas limnophila]RVU24882.1 hypothetical protein EOJ36_07700 [Sandaracinomonas limnophila]
MKKLALVMLVGTLFTHSVSANLVQLSDTVKVSHKKDEMKTLVGVGSKLKSWGISAGPMAQFGSMGSQSGFQVSFHANNKLSIGMAGLFSTKRNNTPMIGAYGPELRQHFMGLNLEYTPKANALVHLSFPLMIGTIAQEDPLAYIQNRIDPTGQPVYDFVDNMYGRNDFNRHYLKSLGVQPGINLEVNLFKYAKLFGGLNYRFAFGENANSDIQGVSGQFGFKFGVFNKKIKK